MRCRRLNSLIYILLPILLITLCRNIPSYSASQTNKIKNNNPNQYTSKNIIIVDMGSTGTRMHAYNIQKSADKPINALPYVTEIAVSKSHDHHAVANFSDKPSEITAHIKPLYQDLKEQLNNLDLDIKDIPIMYYATAGMRLKTAQEQENIYAKIIQTTIEQKHNKNIIKAETIPGELEGIFDWLSVNYKLQTLQNKYKTIAALDMGGASTQVALEIEHDLKHKNKETYNKLNNSFYKLHFSDKNYYIYSKSMLGYGLEQTRENLIQYNENNLANKSDIINCNINTNHIKNKYFDYSKCSNLIKSYLDHRKEHIEIATAIQEAINNNMKIIAYSGFYYNFKFFNSHMPIDLIRKIPDTCNKHRLEFTRKFPNLSEEEIDQACFNSTYLKSLLHDGYNIPDNYHNFRVPKKDIDWTMGAVVYIATEQKSI